MHFTPSEHTTMTTQSHSSSPPPPASDYLTVKSLITRHATMEIQAGHRNSSSPHHTHPQKQCGHPSRGTPRSRRKAEDNHYHQIATNNDDLDLDPREQIALCRSDLRSCGNLHELLESFHQAFSEDQLWAIVFQFMNLYRNAIVLSGGRAASRASSSKQSHLNDSVTSNASSVSTGSPKAPSSRNAPGHSPSRRKSKGAGAQSSKGSLSLQQKKKKAGLDESLEERRSSSSSGGGSDSDVDASDNSDIINELSLLGEGVRASMGKRRASAGGGQDDGGATTGGDLSSSDEGGDNQPRDNDKQAASPRSRLDHVDYLNVPTSLRNFHIHKDGSVHVSYVDEGEWG